MGFAAYLVKPVRQSRLLDCLLQVINAPLHLNVVDHLQLNAATQLPRHSIHTDAGKLKILLAEDSPINQKVALNQLWNLGYDTDVVANGQEVLDLMQKINYDLILMDCQMPVMDGYDATQYIRQAENNSKHTIIIAMTANAMKEDREKCLQVGMDDYLSKPVQKEHLAEKLSHWHWKIQSGEVSHAQPDDVLHHALPEQTLSAQLPLIDWNYLHEISGGNQPFETDLLLTLVAALPDRIEELKTAIASQNYQRIIREAHFIKGSSASMGAVKIAELATQIENQGGCQRLEALDGLILNLEETFNEICILVAQS
jgi:CheY-like chemotaxis protein